MRLQLHVSQPGYPVLVFDDQIRPGKSSLHVTPAQLVMVANVAAGKRVNARVAPVLGQPFVDKGRAGLGCLAMLLVGLWAKLSKLWL